MQINERGFFATSLQKFLTWAQSNSLWYMQVNTGCCADELMNTLGCRYDLERFGCLPVQDPSKADLLVISGLIHTKSAPYIREIYDAMSAPKFVLAVGACACSGGLFAAHMGDEILSSIETLLPVDVWVPGCPPRPEALMNGLIELQEKIRGKFDVTSSF